MLTDTSLAMCRETKGLSPADKPVLLLQVSTTQNSHRTESPAISYWSGSSNIEEFHIRDQELRVWRLIYRISRKDRRRASSQTVGGHYPYASPPVAQTLVVSSQHLWLPSLRPQEGSESGQLSARGFEPRQTPSVGLQACLLTQAHHHHDTPWVKRGWGTPCLCPPFDYPVSDHRRGVKVVSCPRGGSNPRRHQLLAYRPTS